jgi:hypothetical protein
MSVERERIIGPNPGHLKHLADGLQILVPYGDDEKCVHGFKDQYIYVTLGTRPPRGERAKLRSMGWRDATFMKRSLPAHADVTLIWVFVL